MLDNIHLVGHSLGAHVMGSAAKEVQRLGLGKLRRLTGLDPAYPFFESADLYPWRVDKSDADMVQILHTNSGFLWDGCLSFKVNLSFNENIYLYSSFVGAHWSCGLLSCRRQSSAWLH